MSVELGQARVNRSKRNPHADELETLDAELGWGLAPAMRKLEGSTAPPPDESTIKLGSFYYIALSMEDAAAAPDLMQSWMKKGGAFNRGVLGDKKAMKAAKRRCKVLHKQCPSLDFTIYSSISCTRTCPI